MMLAQSGREHYTDVMKHDIARRRYFATDHLKTAIEHQGRTFRWVARQIGVSDSHFNRVLSGERWVSEERARLVAALLSLDFCLLWKVAESTKSVERSAA